MWPYTQQEVTWLAMRAEREATERAERAIDRRWMKEIGVLRQPANDTASWETEAAPR